MKSGFHGKGKMTEIEKLRKELNNALDAFENKPKYEIGKWHWTDSDSLYFIEKNNGRDCYGYGLRYDNNWISGFVCFLENIKRIATDDEVTEMLTKEAIKRGLVEGASADLRNIDVLFRENYTFKTSKYRASSSYFSLDGVFIMQNGIWATVIEEKTKYEVGKWNWTKVGSLFFVEKIDKDKCFGYGLNYNNKWVNSVVCDLKHIKRIATDAEVTEMLTKEAIKRGLAEGASADLRNIDVLFRENYSFKTSNYRASSSYFSLDDVFIMQNGIWATVIEERSLEEWINECMKSRLSMETFIKSTKTELIEILKNLDNE